MRKSASHRVYLNLECNSTRLVASAGTPFWKLVLKQFDDLLVKVRCVIDVDLMKKLVFTLLPGKHLESCPLLLIVDFDCCCCH